MTQIAADRSLHGLAILCRPYDLHRSCDGLRPRAKGGASERALRSSSHRGWCEERTTEMAEMRDPVCSMMVESEDAVSAEHDGKTYYFCSQGCHDSFMAEPEKYAA